jgi:dTDP-4-dehydrorhamnose 3,5-epimerase
VKVHRLKISDAFVCEPQLHRDERGFFFEAFNREQLFAETGHDFELKQVNTSASKKFVLRGIHFADVPLGQAKYVTVTSGRIIDFIVDVRQGSKTFGDWTSVEMSAENRTSVFIAEGLGHAFLALQDDTVVSYLVSDTFRPARERAVNIFDSDIGLVLPIDSQDLIISDKDREAPSLTELLAEGLLPRISDCRAQYSAPKRHSTWSGDRR